MSIWLGILKQRFDDHRGDEIGETAAAILVLAEVLQELHDDIKIIREAIERVERTTNATSSERE